VISRSWATSQKTIVLIDANNFYASCEAVMDPAVLGRPLVVLSNNDGCIVSRSTEARALGIRMGQPYFQVRRELERQGVVVRSSNYALYADMSQRLVATVEPWVEALEIYSIDEVFGQLTRTAGKGDLQDWGHRLRHHVLCQLGLPVAVGIAPSKVLAKLANRLAKTTASHAGVFDFGGVTDPDSYLESIAIEEVWGIGRQLSRWCRLRGIVHARALRDMGRRLQQELQGHACLPLEIVPAAKRETCVSRSFSEPITKKASLREAVATYLSRAAEKLRRQHQRAGVITVFVRSSPFNGTSLYSNSATVTLPVASNDTAVLLQAALPLVERLFKPHKPLQKAGVLLQNLQSEEILQHHLLMPLPLEKQRRRSALMASIDSLNRRYGSGTVQWAAAGLQTPWRMRRSQLSRATTTQVEEIPIVHA
jgi:DNA polymerase V